MLSRSKRLPLRSPLLQVLTRAEPDTNPNLNIAFSEDSGYQSKSSIAFTTSVPFLRGSVGSWTIVTQNPQKKSGIQANFVAVQRIVAGAAGQ